MTLTTVFGATLSASVTIGCLVLGVSVTVTAPGVTLKYAVAVSGDTVPPRLTETVPSKLARS